MLGIGLGSFVDGFSDGYGIRQSIDENNERKAAKARIGEIDVAAKAEFDKEVAAGTADAADFDKFWMDYALPKLAHERVLSGDIQGAKALSEWGETRAAREGGRLFSSAMLKAHTGDASGALQDVFSAAKIKGYLDHNVEITGQDELVDQEGNVLGYRLSFKDSDGNVGEQDITLDQLPSLVSTFINPEAAFESQQAAKADAAKREQDLEDFATKEKIKADAKGGEGGGKVARTNAIKSLRSRMDGGGLLNDGEPQPAFDDLPREEQEKLIQAELDLQSGETTPTPPAKRMAVDEGTGAAVQPSAKSEAVGLGAAAAPSAVSKEASAPAPASKAQPSAPTPQPRPATRSAAVGIGGAAVGGSQPQPNTDRNRQQILAEARNMMIQGGNPQIIAQRLKKAGVSDQEIAGALQQ